ncbi:MAG: hypothetical protein LBT24_01960, partial [Tannerella sp.]|nr:hypothetical protein [Tannerella sp.]
MKVTNTLLLLTFTFLSPHFASAQDSFQQMKDSLLKVVAASSGTEKLEACKKLCRLPIAAGYEDEYFKFSEDLIGEAQKQGNLDVEGEAKVDEVVKLYNYNKKEELFKKADLYLPFFTKNEQWKNYYTVYFLLIESHIYAHRYEKAMQEAKRIYEQSKAQADVSGIETATYLMALVYTNTSRLDEAETFYRATISLSDDPDNFSNPRRRAFEDLCRLMLKKK